jgi:hypothetical protein
LSEAAFGASNRGQITHLRVPIHTTVHQQQRLQRSPAAEATTTAATAPLTAPRLGSSIGVEGFGWASNTYELVLVKPHC